jgi:hypothetical protein
MLASNQVHIISRFCSVEGWVCTADRKVTAIFSYVSALNVDFESFNNLRYGVYLTQEEFFTLWNSATRNGSFHFHKATEGCHIYSNL